MARVYRQFKVEYQTLLDSFSRILSQRSEVAVRMMDSDSSNLEIVSENLASARWSTLYGACLLQAIWNVLSAHLLTMRY